MNLVENQYLNDEISISTRYVLIIQHYEVLKIIQSKEGD